jgi:hypothetical protein
MLLKVQRVTLHRCRISVLALDRSYGTQALAHEGGRVEDRLARRGETPGLIHACM